MEQVLAPITSNDEVMPGVRLIWLEAAGIARRAQPGQFVMLRCGGYTLPRPFSIHRTDGDRLALLFKMIGDGTGWLSQLKPGEVVSTFGPLGNGFSIDPKAQNLLLVAGGMGIAPLVFLAEMAAKQERSIKLLLGGQTAAQIYPCDFLANEIEVIHTTEDATLGIGGRVTVLVPDYFAWAAQVFACGPLPMYKTMAGMPELKNKKVQVSLEMRMGCGTGVCYGCTIKTKGGLKQVCHDGPVFDLREIVWGEMPGV
ncbi:MAG: dihydroorotate dehydrogenase electron transfer subunit [Chloroflexota bacterium]